MPTIINIEAYAPALGSPRYYSDMLGTSGGAWRGGVLVRVPNWLGDSVMSLPAVAKLKQLLPLCCRVTVLCKRNLADLWETAPFVDGVVGFSGHRVTGLAAEALRGLQAGVAVVLPNSFGSALDVWGKGIPLRIGRGGRGRSILLTHRLPVIKRPQGYTKYHQLRHSLEIVSVLGACDWDARCEPLKVSPDWLPSPEVRCFVQVSPLLVLAPGAAYGPAKQWPAEHFRKVACAWAEEQGAVAVVGTAADRALGDTILKGLPKTMNLAGETNLRGLMAVLSTADMIVANDSGTMHLGAALGRCGVAVFGSTDSVATGPLGGKWIVLEAHYDCAPCFGRICRRTGGECLNLRSIRPDDVLTAVNKLLQFRGGEGRL